VLVESNSVTLWIPLAAIGLGAAIGAVPLAWPSARPVVAWAAPILSALALVVSALPTGQECFGAELNGRQTAWSCSAFVPITRWAPQTIGAAVALLVLSFAAPLTLRTGRRAPALVAAALQAALLLLAGPDLVVWAPAMAFTAATAVAAAGGGGPGPAAAPGQPPGGG
jgi:hypothetical protein